mgnify:CR=1 FL=1
MLISEEYRKLNEDRHRMGSFGVYGAESINHVMNLCKFFITQDVLDYGCGQSILAKNMPFMIHQYDPAIPLYAREPKPADIVVCTDVLEHIEPECLEDVLAHLQSLTKKGIFFIVATVPALKHMPDGTNCHKIIEPYTWWIEKLTKRWMMIRFEMMKNGFIYVGGLNG